MEYKASDVVVYFVDYQNHEVYATVNGKRQEGIRMSPTASIPEMEKVREKMQKIRDEVN